MQVHFNNRPLSCICSCLMKFWHCNVTNKCTFRSIFPDYPDICSTSETQSASTLIMFWAPMLFFSLQGLSTVKAPLDDGYKEATKKNLRLYQGFSYNYKAWAQHAKPLWAPRKPNKRQINVESIKTKIKQVFIIKLCVCCWWHALAFQTFCRQMYSWSKLWEIEYFYEEDPRIPSKYVYTNLPQTRQVYLAAGWCCIPTLLSG